MDKTETWIKMCENAKNILPEHKYEIGDWYSTVFHDGVFLVQDLDAWADTPLYLRHPSECFPIYRQDQLQEMLPELIAKSGFVPSVVGHFADFVCSVELYPLPFTTFEQSWLAFVMKEKYNKVWDGEAWNDCH